MLLPESLGSKMFSRDLFWRSGLLEYRIVSFVLGHWYGCAAQPGPLVGLTLKSDFKFP